MKNPAASSGVSEQRVQIGCVPDSGEDLQCSLFLGGFTDLIDLGFFERPKGRGIRPQEIKHAVRYTELAPGRFKDIWLD